MKRRSHIEIELVRLRPTTHSRTNQPVFYILQNQIPAIYNPTAAVSPGFAMTELVARAGAGNNTRVPFRPASSRLAARKTD